MARLRAATDRRCRRDPRRPFIASLDASCWFLDELGRTMRRNGTRMTGNRKEARLVGLVLISHSGKLVEGLREMVAQVAGDDVPVATAGGTEDGRLGTSAPRIAEAIRAVLDAGADDALVLLDLGSAALSLELALEDLDDRPIARGSASARRRSSRARSSPRSRPASAPPSTRSRRPPTAPRRWPSCRGPEATARASTHRHRSVRAPRPAGGPVRPGGEPVRRAGSSSARTAARPTPRASSPCSV